MEQPIRTIAAMPLATVALTAALAATPAFAQDAANTWEYKSYKRDSYGQYSKDNFVPGKIAITEKGGQAQFRMIAGRVGVCYDNDLPAVVTRTEAETKIEVTQVVPGCEQFRYTIRNDGSGGMKETKRAESERWTKSRFDHGLTPVKP